MEQLRGRRITIRKDIGTGRRVHLATRDQEQDRAPPTTKADGARLWLAATDARGCACPVAGTRPWTGIAARRFASTCGGVQPRRSHRSVKRGYRRNWAFGNGIPIPQVECLEVLGIAPRAHQLVNRHFNLLKAWAVGTPQTTGFGASLTPWRQPRHAVAPARSRLELLARIRRFQPVVKEWDQLLACHAPAR
jgi:hypothetical protein